TPLQHRCRSTSTAHLRPPVSSTCALRSWGIRLPHLRRNLGVVWGEAIARRAHRPRNLVAVSAVAPNRPPPHGPCAGSAALFPRREPCWRRRALRAADPAV